MSGYAFGKRMYYISFSKYLYTKAARAAPMNGPTMNTQTHAIGAEFLHRNKSPLCIFWKYCIIKE